MEQRGNSKAHVCRPLGEPFWKLARCHRRISVPSLVALSTRSARESSKIKSRGLSSFRPFRRKAAGQLLLRISYVYSCNTAEQWLAFKCYRFKDHVYIRYIALIRITGYDVSCYSHKRDTRTHFQKWTWYFFILINISTYLVFALHILCL